MAENGNIGVDNRVPEFIPQNMGKQLRLIEIKHILQNQKQNLNSKT